MSEMSDFLCSAHVTITMTTVLLLKLFRRAIHPEKEIFKKKFQYFTF